MEMKVLNVLLIEDDAIEIMKFNRVVNEINVPKKIVEAHNGEEALNIIAKAAFIPNIIILDLNMPKINGIEFLRELKSKEAYKYIPAIILTTSNSRKDILECYKIGIAGYLLKPLKYEDYKNRVHKLIEYWSCNELISQ